MKKSYIEEIQKPRKKGSGGLRVAGPGKKLGAPSRGPSKPFQARLSLELVERLKTHCILTGKTQKQVLEKALLEYLSKAGKILAHRNQTGPVKD